MCSEHVARACSESTCTAAAAGEECERSREKASWLGPRVARAVGSGVQEAMEGGRVASTGCSAAYRDVSSAGTMKGEEPVREGWESKT